MGVFLCLLPEGEAVGALAALERPARDGVRYEPPERLHVTLRYFGDLDESTISALAETTAEVASLSGEVAIELGPATERLGRDGTLVLPAAGAAPLAALVDQVLATTGLDRRLPDRDESFFGHLTVARLRRRAALSDDLLGASFSSSFVATSIHLIDSVPSEQGRRYRHVVDERLRGGS